MVWNAVQKLSFRVAWESPSVGPRPTISSYGPIWSHLSWSEFSWRVDCCGMFSKVFLWSFFDGFMMRFPNTWSTGPQVASSQNFFLDLSLLELHVYSMHLNPSRNFNLSFPLKIGTAAKLASKAYFMLILTSMWIFPFALAAFPVCDILQSDFVLPEPTWFGLIVLDLVLYMVWFSRMVRNFDTYLWRILVFCCCYAGL